MESRMVSAGNILYINTCMRRESRTRELAERILSRLDGRVEEINPTRDGIRPLDEESLEKRTQLAGAGDFSDPMFDPAKKFAAADTIVIAAPYWDLSFPAVLKAFFEQICVVGLTFNYGEDEKAYGMCRAKRLIYVTTAGGYMIPEDLGFGYVKALAREFYGIPRVYCLKAEGLDLYGADTESIRKDAAQRADALIEEILAEEE